MASNNFTFLTGQGAGASSLVQQKQDSVAKAKTTTEAKLHSDQAFTSIVDFDKAYPNATPLERDAALQDILSLNARASDRTTFEALGDVGASLGQGVQQSIAGPVYGGLKFLTSYDPDSPDNPTYDAYGTQTEPEDYGPFSYDSEDFPESTLRADLDDFADIALDQLQSNKDTVKDALSSTASKAQAERYRRESTAHKNTPEYQNASAFQKIWMDAGGSAKGMWDNPLVALDTGIQGIADLGTSIITGAAVGKAATAMGASSAVAKGATSAGVTIQGAISEGSSNAQGAANEVKRMTHEELMESDEYRDVLEKVGGDKEKAKEVIANRVFRNTFAGTGLSSALIGRITGADKAAADVAAGSVRKIGKALEGTARETVEEATQSGTGQAQANLAVKEEAKPDKELTEGVGEAIVMGTVGGFMAGGAAQSGALTSTAAKVAKVLPKKALTSTATKVVKGAKVLPKKVVTSTATTVAKVAKILAKKAVAKKVPAEASAEVVEEVAKTAEEAKAGPVNVEEKVPYEAEEPVDVIKGLANAVAIVESAQTQEEKEVAALAGLELVQKTDAQVVELASEARSLMEQGKGEEALAKAAEARRLRARLKTWQLP